MTRSETINDLAAALTKAQAVMEGAKKDATNPHFKSAYADLASVWDACREPLTSNGLSVVQSPRLVAANETSYLIEVETVLLHVSGQFMADSLGMPVSKQDAQGVGSAITYARRYALSAMVGVAPEDDDANGAVAKSSQMRTEIPPPAPRGFDRFWTDFQAVALTGIEPLTAAWKAASEEYRNYANQTRRPAVEALQASARIVTKKAEQAKDQVPA